MTDYPDIMHPTVTQFAYLKCPSKVRAAIINAGGPRLSDETIKRHLARLPVKIEGAHIGEPTPEDEPDFRVRGLVGPQPRKIGVTRITDEERETILRLSAQMKDRNPNDIRPTSAFRPYGQAYSSTDSADDLIDYVCERMEIPRDVFFGPSRISYLVAARSLVVKVLRDRNPRAYSYPRIAAIIGRKDHTTIINLHSQFEKFEAMYCIIDRLYREITQGA